MGDRVEELEKLRKAGIRAEKGYEFAAYFNMKFITESLPYKLSKCLYDKGNTLFEPKLNKPKPAKELSEPISGNDSCKYANDKVCDAPTSSGVWLCDPRTDCTDCGNCDIPNATTELK